MIVAKLNDFLFFIAIAILASTALRAYKVLVQAEAHFEDHEAGYDDDEEGETTTLV